MPRCDVLEAAGEAAGGEAATRPASGDGAAESSTMGLEARVTELLPGGEAGSDGGISSAVA